MKFLILVLIAASLSSPVACPDGVCTDLPRESSVLMQRLNRNGRQLPMRVAKQAVPVAKKDGGFGDLHQVAADMLREGTTGDILEFANDTLSELEGMVLPNLMHGFEADKKILEDMMLVFTHAEEAFAAGMAEVETLEAREEQDALEHKQCREDEEQDCASVNVCESERLRLWSIYKTIEIEYLAVVRSIKQQWCVAYGNRSEAAWRESVESRFEHYMTIGEERITKLKAHDEWLAGCEERNSSLVDIKSVCDEQKKKLEVLSCNRLAKEHWASEQLDIAWQIATEAHAEISEAVRAREELRHKEFKSIKGIKCLLKHIVERSFKACTEEDDPGEYTAIVTECESFWQIDVGFSLDPWSLTFPEVPAKPKKPDHGLVPCSDEYVAAQYADVVSSCAALPPCLPCSQAEYSEQEDAHEGTI